MKCPYITNSISVELETKINELSKAYITEVMHDCIESDCAAWQNGHCVRTA